MGRNCTFPYYEVLVSLNFHASIQEPASCLYLKNLCLKLSLPFPHTRKTHSQTPPLVSIDILCLGYPSKEESPL